MSDLRKPAAGIRASNLKIINKNTLVGSADIRVVAWGATFKGCLWRRKGQREWINFAAKEWTDTRGERRFANLVELDLAVHDRFQSAALAAVHQLAERGAA